MTIEERAKIFSRDSAYQSSYEGYIKGAEDQYKEDIKYFAEWLDKNVFPNHAEMEKASERFFKESKK